MPIRIEAVSATRSRQWMLATALSMSLHIAVGWWWVWHSPDPSTGSATANPRGALHITFGGRLPSPVQTSSDLDNRVAAEPRSPAVARMAAKPIAPSPRFEATVPAVPAEVTEDAPLAEPASGPPGRTAPAALPQVASAPPTGGAPSTGDRSETTTGSGVAARGGAWSFHASVSDRVQRLLRYPRRAERAGTQGTALVSVHLDRAGLLTRVELGETSGSPVLDRNAVRTVERAAPFGRVPDAVPDSGLDFDIPVTYVLPGSG